MLQYSVIYSIIPKMAFVTLDYRKYKFPNLLIPENLFQFQNLQFCASNFEVSEWLECLEGMGGNRASKLVQRVEKMNLNGAGDQLNVNKVGDQLNTNKEGNLDTGGGDKTDGCFPR